jgi:hypothetical protein
MRRDLKFHVHRLYVFRRDRRHWHVAKASPHILDAGGFLAPPPFAFRLVTGAEVPPTDIVVQQFAERHRASAGFQAGAEVLTVLSGSPAGCPAVVVLVPRLALRVADRVAVVVAQRACPPDPKSKERITPSAVPR